MRQSEAQLIAREMSKKYINRVNLLTQINTIDEHMLEMTRAFASPKPIDTIICMDGCEVIGAYLAQELLSLGVTSNNKQSFVLCHQPGI